MASKAIELFSKNTCVGDIELLYRLAVYTRLAGSYVVQYIGSCSAWASVVLKFSRGSYVGS